MKNDKIAFILPRRESNPVGGYKIVYEYANRFAQAGYDVSIIYPHVRTYWKQDIKNPFLRIKMQLGFLYRRKRHQYQAGEWFALEATVRKIFVFTVCSASLRLLKHHKIIATAVETAYALAAAHSVPCANKYYFIQDFEAWNGHTDEYVYHSYRFPMKKIVIAPWLAQRVEYAGEKSVLIPNGFDFGYFQLTNPIENRLPYEVAMLYHKDDRKRCCDSIEALKIVKQKIPQLHVTMFGTPEKPELPEWFGYIRCPDKETHNKIYNNAAIFVAASKTEGFGLTVGESMICGCAVACTDNEGFSMMIKNEQTGLLSPVFDIEKLAENILRLIQNDHLRIRIAKQGNEFIQQFTWERAFSSFIEALEK